MGKHKRAVKKEPATTNGLQKTNDIQKFMALNRLITRDLNKHTTTTAFTRFTKDDITTYLAKPYNYQKQLREAVNYIYGASTHFRRLIQYFASLTDLSYVVSPYRVDAGSINQKTFNRNYRRVLNVLSSMSIKTQFPKIVEVCLREDTFYGTLWVTPDNITVQQLPSDYCQISTVEGNVPNVTFDFSYFNTHRDMLDYYPAEFAVKYEMYRNNQRYRWIELDAPTSFAIKCNKDILDYSLPPFAGILREVYDIEEYKQLKMTKTAIENYALLVMRLPMSDDRYLIDYNKAKDFWSNLDSVMPEEVGSVLSPMEITKIGFDRSNTGETDAVADAEQNLFTAAGVSSLLFNNQKAAASALALSIKADQSLTYEVVKSIEDMVNRFIQYQSYGKNFKVTFLDVSPFNRKEAGDAYLKACQYGIPMISYYCASQGLAQSELDSMSLLETQVLGLQDIFKPLKSSATMSSEESKGATDEGGAPKKSDEELTESGEQSREVS